MWSKLENDTLSLIQISGCGKNMEHRMYCGRIQFNRGSNLCEITEGNGRKYQRAWDIYRIRLLNVGPISVSENTCIKCMS